MAAASTTDWSTLYSVSNGAEGGTEGLNAIACSSSSDCVAVGYAPNTSGVSNSLIEPAAVETTDGGADWAPDTVSAGNDHQPFLSVACLSPGVCIAANANYVYFEDGWPGGSFSNGFALMGSATAAYVACPGSSTCYVAEDYVSAGAERTTILYANHTSVWSWQTDLTLPASDAGVVSAITCPSVTRCVAVGTAAVGALIVTTTNGWQTAKVQTSQAPMLLNANLDSVSCPSTTWCMAAGWSFITGNPFDPRSPWLSGESFPFADGGPWAASGVLCVTTADCDIVGRIALTPDPPMIAETTDGGGSWTEESIPDDLANQASGVDPVNALTCASKNVCFAVSQKAGVTPGVEGNVNASTAYVLQDNGDALSSHLFSVVGSPRGADRRGGGCGCASGSVDPQPSTTRPDPVNTATGDFFTSATDLSVPGAGPPLAFTRTYDAQAAQAEAGSGAPPPPLGYGWTDNLQMSLQVGPTIATVTQANGSQITFDDTGGDTDSWCVTGAQFCATAPRFEATLGPDPTVSGDLDYTTYGNGATTYRFSASGLLDQVTNAAGTLSSSSYAGCVEGDSCVQWTNNSGRSLVVESDSNGDVVSVFDPDNLSATASSFAYSGSGCTSFQTRSPNDLCSVTDPGSRTYLYGYQDGSDQSFAYDLTDVTDPGDPQPLVNTYDPSSGQVLQQTDPAGEVTTFSYSGDPLDDRTGGETKVFAGSEETDYLYLGGVLSAESGAGSPGHVSHTYVPSEYSTGASLDFVGNDAGTTAKCGHSLRTARRTARLQAQARSAAAMLVAPSMRRRPIAVFRSVAITRGALPVLTVEASSR